MDLLLFLRKMMVVFENVKGAYSLLDKLIKAIPQLQDAQLAVNPLQNLSEE